MKITTKQITLAGMFAALAVVLDYLSFHSDTSKLTFYSLPLLLSGMLFGPWVGLLTGTVTGFLSQLLTFGLSPTTPLWMLAPMSWGFFSGIILHYGFKKHKGNNLSLIVTIVSTSLIATALNTLCLFLDGLIYHYPTPYVLTKLAARILVALLIDVLYSTFMVLAYPRLSKFVSTSWKHKHPQKGKIKKDQQVSEIEEPSQTK